MATAVAVASRLVSETHTSSSSENTPSAVHRLQMAIADTECAQALLELAMSIVPTPPSPPLTDHPILSPDSTEPKSLLKREFDSTFIKQEQSDEETYRLDLVKRIKLDHNYYWTGEDRKTGEVILEPDQFRTYCETIKQNGSVPTSSENSQDGDLENSPSITVRSSESGLAMMYGSSSPLPAAHTPPGQDMRFHHRQRTVSETTVVPSRMPRQRSSSESKMITSTWKPRGDRKTSLLKSKTGRGGANAGDNEENPPAMLKDSDSELAEGDGSSATKFHNFQLLLKCLVANEPEEARALDSLDEGGGSHRTLSMSSDDTDEGMSHMSPSRQNQSSHDYQCQVCQKTFLKKRYLTKHAFRMHPWLNSPDEESINTNKVTSAEGICPHCKVVIKPKKDLAKHMASCCTNDNYKKTKKQNDLDLVSCQLCGVKMRRQLLVRHLAEEHCVDRLVDYPVEQRSSPYNSITVHKAEASGKSRETNASESLEAAGSSEPKSKQQALSITSWQQANSKFGATTTKDIRHHESPTNQKAAYSTM